jgi:hypothetical protein
MPRIVGHVSAPFLEASWQPLALDETGAKPQAAVEVRSVQGSEPGPRVVKIGNVERQRAIECDVQSASHRQRKSGGLPMLRVEVAVLARLSVVRKLRENLFPDYRIDLLFCNLLGTDAEMCMRALAPSGVDIPLRSQCKG